MWYYLIIFLKVGGMKVIQNIEKKEQPSLGVETG